jgi:hypothetical protein
MGCCESSNRRKIDETLNPIMGTVSLSLLVSGNPACVHGSACLQSAHSIRHRACSTTFCSIWPYTYVTLAIYILVTHREMSCASRERESCILHSHLAVAFSPLPTHPPTHACTMGVSVSPRALTLYAGGAGPACAADE